MNSKNQISTNSMTETQIQDYVKQKEFFISSGAVQNADGSFSISNENLQPSNILVTPSNHKVTITNFKYAVNFERGSKHNCVHEFSPPEVRDKFKGPHPGVDIYSIGKIGLYLLGVYFGFLVF